MRTKKTTQHFAMQVEHPTIASYRILSPTNSNSAPAVDNDAANMLNRAPATAINILTQPESIIEKTAPSHRTSHVSNTVHCSNNNHVEVNSEVIFVHETSARDTRKAESRKQSCIQLFVNSVDGEVIVLGIISLTKFNECENTLLYRKRMS